MASLLRHTPRLSLNLAMHLLRAALEAADTHQAEVSIAIVGPDGEMIHTAHMDNAPLLSRDIARNKALTAASFKVSTSGWQERLSACSAGVRQGLALQPNMACFGGGEPFFHQGHLVGAIGISGASEKIDERCAKAAVERLERLLEMPTLEPAVT